MNQRKSIFLILVIILFLAGCQSSNKVVSTFGKRKYTKGYFFSHPPLLPANAIAINKSKQKSIQKNIVENILPAYHAAATSPAQFYAHLPKIISKTVLYKSIDKLCPVISYSKKTNEPSITPGHNIAEQTNKNPTYFGLIGFILAILAPVTAIFSTVALPLATIVAIFYVASLVLCIVGLCVKTDKYKGFATAGLIIDIVEVLLIILLFLLFIGGV